MRPLYSRKRRKAASSQPDAPPDSVSSFTFIMLPCQRCGQWSVPVPNFFFHTRGQTFSCRSCEAEHFLSISRKGNEYAICYQRYTLRYPIEDYDDGLEFPVVVMHASRRSVGESDSESCAGPIVVYPRKSRFTRAEVRSIWQASKGRCHLCNRRWLLQERGRRGWHIDHVIPHIGGGRDTESMPNLKIACARCNLQKGRGYREASIRLALSKLIKALEK